MEFCRNCGSELNEDAVFCVQCGAKTAEESTHNVTGNIQEAPLSNQSVNLDSELKQKTTNKTVGMVVVGVVALIALILVVKIIGSFTTPAYEKPIKNMITGLQTGNFDKFLDSYPEYLQEMLEDYADNYDDEEEYMEMMLESLEDNYGKKIKMSYKVTDKDKMDEDDLEDLEDYIKSTYSEKVKLKAGYELEVEMKIKGSKDDDKDDVDLKVVKIGSKWYLIDRLY